MSHLYRFVLGDSELHAEVELSGERASNLFNDPIRQRPKPPRHLNHIGYKLVQIAIPERSTVRRNVTKYGRNVIKTRNKQSPVVKSDYSSTTTVTVVHTSDR